MAKRAKLMDTQGALEAILATDNEDYSSDEDSIAESDTEYTIHMDRPNPCMHAVQVLHVGSVSKSDDEGGSESDVPVPDQNDVPVPDQNDSRQSDNDSEVVQTVHRGRGRARGRPTRPTRGQGSPTPGPSRVLRRPPQIAVTYNEDYDDYDDEDMEDASPSESGSDVGWQVPVGSGVDDESSSDDNQGVGLPVGVPEVRRFK